MSRILSGWLLWAAMRLTDAAARLFTWSIQLKEPR